MRAPSPLSSRCSCSRPTTARRRTDSPLDHLPPNVEVLTHFGERADISPDDRRVAFMAKSFGDAFVIDLETRAIRCLTCNVPGAAFLRVMHLPSSDYLLIGPEHFVDLGRSRGRDNELWFLSRKPGSRPVKLGRRMSEGAAVSKRSTKIAFSVGHAQDAAVPEGQTRLVVADLDASDAPALRDERVVFTSDGPALQPRGPGLLRRRPQAHLHLLRARGPRERLDDRPRDRRASQSVGRDRLLQRGRGHLPRRPLRLRRERPPVARLRRPGQLPQHRHLEAPARRDRPRLRPPHHLQRPRGLEGLEPRRLPRRPLHGLPGRAHRRRGRRRLRHPAATPQRIEYQRAVVIATTRPSHRR